jgi:hypothetical protein
MEDSYLDSYWEDRAELAFGSHDAFDHNEPRHAEQPEEEEPAHWAAHPAPSYRAQHGRCEDAPCCGCCGGE